MENIPYKIVPTKTCSECGQVLESKRDDYCDGCNIQISQSKKDYDDQIRLGFLMENSDEHKEDMVFHSLECFQENHGKIELKGVQCVSIEYIAPKMLRRLMEILSK